MGFLDSLKKAKESGVQADWKVLTTEGQLNQLIEDSKAKPVIIFKHSVTCGISGMAKFNLERAWDFKEEEIDFYYLDLLAFRSVSNKIASVLGVTHQSPQVILVSNGKAVYAASHQAVSVAGIRGGLEKA